MASYVAFCHMLKLEEARPIIARARKILFSQNLGK